MTEAITLLRIGSSHPRGVWDALATVVVFASTAGVIAHLVRNAVAELRDRERALHEARNRAELKHELLSTHRAQSEVVTVHGDSVGQPSAIGV